MDGDLVAMCLDVTGDTRKVLIEYITSERNATLAEAGRLGRKAQSLSLLLDRLNGATCEPVNNGIDKTVETS